MDDFTVYGNTFEEALENLEKVLKICKEENLSLSHEFFFMMFTEGIVLRHHISGDGIKVDNIKLKSSPNYQFQVVKRMLEFF